MSPIDEAVHRLLDKGVYTIAIEKMLEEALNALRRPVVGDSVVTGGKTKKPKPKLMTCFERLAWIEERYMFIPHDHPSQQLSL